MSNENIEVEAGNTPSISEILKMNATGREHTQKRLICKDRKGKVATRSFFIHDGKYILQEKSEGVSNDTVKEVIKEIPINNNGHKLDIALYTSGTYALREWIPRDNGEYRKSGITDKAIPNKKVGIPSTIEAIDTLVKALKDIGKSLEA